MRIHQEFPKKLFVGVILFAIPSLAAAQGPEGFQEAQMANADALKAYTWKSRKELKLKGESKSVQLEQVRYDMHGKLQKTPIGGPSPEQESESAKPKRRRRGGRIKDKIVEKKKGEFTELMESLVKLVVSYSHLPPDKIAALRQNASMSPGEGAMQGTLQLNADDVLFPGDKMVIWIDTANLLFRRVEIDTVMEEKPVKVIADFRSVAQGPVYLGRSVVHYPSKEIELTVDNYDYQRVGS